MLFIFRKLRRSLMKTEGIRKYSLYAIGEIVLVVLGILIALQINNWNEWRKERIIEHQILNDLKISLVADVENQIDPNLRWISRDIQNVNHIIDAIENKLPYQDSLSIKFRSMMTSKSFRWELTAYKNLENEGLNVISNSLLKDEIVRLYNMNYPALEYRISNFSNNLIEFFRPEMRMKFKYIHSDFNKNKYVPIDYEALFDDVQIMNNLVTAKINFISIQDVLEETKSVVQELITDIEKEHQK